MKKKLISLLLVVLLLTGLVLPIVAFADGEPYTVSFDPGTGTGSMASVTVNAGEGYTLPACTFTHTNSERTFYRWSVGDELKAPGDPITVSADTTVTALWVYTAVREVDNTQDNSTTNYVGKLVMTDTRTGTMTTEALYDETASSTFTAPMNSAVASLKGDCVSTLMTALYSYPNAHFISYDMPTLDVDHAEVVYSWNHIIFRYEEAPDEAGDYVRTMYMEGDYGKAWRFTETVTGEYTSEEEDPAPTPEPIEEVVLSVYQPTIGETTETESPDVTAGDWKYEVTDAIWVDSAGNALSSPLAFESGATYYISATVRSYWDWDSTYFFPQSGMTVTVENGGLVGAPNITNISGAASTMQVLIAVQAVVRRPGDQIQVWVGNIDGNTTMTESGGKVATTYTPSEPNIYDFGKDGTFYAGDIVQFYPGDEITVTAQADTGYHFVGWYRVNIDYNMSGGDTDHNGNTPNKAYMGSVISSATSFTYKPGVTVLSGDTEPLRYICAVFEENTTPAHGATEIQVWIGDTAGNEPGDSYKGGQVAVSYTPSYDDYPEDVVAKDGTEFGYGQIFGCYLGDEITLYAQPDSGFRFVGWYEADGAWPKNGPQKYTGEALSTATSFTCTPTETFRLICAVFEELPPIPATYTVTVNAAEHGSVSADKTSAAEGEPVTLTVTPDSHYELDTLTVTDAGSNPVTVNADNTFTMPASNVTVTATFKEAVRYLCLGTSTGGQYDLTTSDNLYTGLTDSLNVTGVKGETITLIAAPDSGYTFKGWYQGTRGSSGFVEGNNGTLVSSDATYSFTLNENTNLQAVFEAVNCTISVTAAPTAGGTVSGSGTFSGGASVTVTATPNTGYRFVNWTAEGTEVSTEATYTFNATADVALTANFVQLHSVTVEATPTEGGTVTGGGTFDAGSSVTVTATPAAGYRFVKWTEGGADVSTEASYTFTATADRALVANFVQTYAVTVTAIPTEGGTVSGGGTVDAGSSVTVTATPSTGYRFVKWTEDGAEVSPEASYTFTAAGDRALTANFELIPTYTVTVTNDGNGTGTASPASGPEGTEITLTATPNEGYRLKEWQVISGGITVTDNKFTLGSVNVEVKAVFELIPSYTVKFSMDCGSDVPDQTVLEGSKATKPADPTKEDFIFDGWYQDATFSVAFDFDTAITADTTIYAKWANADYILTSVTGATTDASHTWTKGSTSDVVITVKLNDGVDNSFAHFTSFQIDGTTLTRDTDYTAHEGSTVITVKAATMQRLSVGAHTATINFDNGSVQTRLTVKAAPGSTTSPRTGDTSLTSLWAVLVTISGLGLGAMFAIDKKSRYVGKH